MCSLNSEEDWKIKITSSCHKLISNLKLRRGLKVSLMFDSVSISLILKLRRGLKDIKFC